MTGLRTRIVIVDCVFPAVMAFVHSPPKIRQLLTSIAKGFNESVGYLPVCVKHVCRHVFACVSLPMRHALPDARAVGKQTTTKNKQTRNKQTNKQLNNNNNKTKQQTKTGQPTNPILTNQPTSQEQEQRNREKKERNQ